MRPNWEGKVDRGGTLLAHKGVMGGEVGAVDMLSGEELKVRPRLREKMEPHDVIKELTRFFLEAERDV